MCSDCRARQSLHITIHCGYNGQKYSISWDCVVLEVSEAGILAAHNAGMLPIMIPDLKQPTPEIRALAYRVLPTLHEVPPLIEAFLQTGLPLAG